jgi:hypothetical protein
MILTSPKGTFGGCESFGFGHVADDFLCLELTSIVSETS